MKLRALAATRRAVASCLLGLLDILGLLNVGPYQLLAQTTDSGMIPGTVPGESWSPAERIPDSIDRIGTPLLLADRDRTVYVFVSEDVGTGKQIFIRKWRLDGGWTPAVDVSAPAMIAQICGAFLDSEGNIHLAYYGIAPGTGPEMYYAHANARVADSAAAWSPPQSVGTGVIEPFCTLQGDGNGNLVIVFNSNVYGNSLNAVSSSDGGTTWSEPEVIYATESQDTYPAPVRGTADGQGNVHVVWSVWRPPTGGEEVYYSQMDAKTREWREPLLLMSKLQTGSNADWPAVVFYDDELLVFIQVDLGKLAQFMVRSIDGGQTWSAPERAFPNLYGGHGHVVGVVDGSGNLHAVLCNRTEVTLIHGAWHSLWRNGVWTPVESIVSGQKSPYFDPTLPDAVVVQGNVVFVAWHMDGAPGAFYSYRILDGVPELAVTPVPPRSTATSSPITVATPTLHASAMPADESPVTALPQSMIQAPMPSRQSPMTAVLVGTAAAALVIGIVLLVRPKSS